jgi:hypothetical protein
MGSGGPEEENVDRLVRYKNPYDMARGGGSKASSPNTLSSPSNYFYTT